MGPGIFMELVSSWKWVRICFSEITGLTGFTGTIRGMPGVALLMALITLVVYNVSWL